MTISERMRGSYGPPDDDDDGDHDAALDAWHVARVTAFGGFPVLQLGGELAGAWVRADGRGLWTGRPVIGGGVRT